MKIKSTILSVILLCSTMIACTGGGTGGGYYGGGNSGGGIRGGSGNAGYSHSDLAYIFVEDLNYELGLTGYTDLEYVVAKSSTEQYNYMVIYNPYIGEYHAIDISGYDPYGSIYAEDYYVYYTYPELDLTPLSGNRYRGASGLVYEKTQATPKDLVKVKALKEAIMIDMAAKNISSKLGLSIKRSKEVAKLQRLWAKSSVKSMTDAEVNSFSTELLGFSMSRGIEAMSAGSSDDINTLIDIAAETNGITPEHAEKLMMKMFGL
jgi:hypothetical protein